MRCRRSLSSPGCVIAKSPKKKRKRKSAIATFNEGPLHAALKDWIQQPGDKFEVPLDGRQIDIVRGDLLIEIQTRGFSALKRKLTRLVEDHPVRLVYPLALEKWIISVEGEERKVLRRRKSPRRGKLLNVFEELVSVAALVPHPNFTLEILLTQEEEVRRQEGRSWRRNGWVVLERRLVDVTGAHVIADTSDLLAFLPATLPTPFGTADLAEHLDIKRHLAQQLAYCLRQSGATTIDGKKGNALTYVRAPTS